ncbi:MAG TPA: hypothetical protein VES91_09685 [Burkholderiaceae bacterium]|nr:hypothetical protein [Burkholderiaceae bacterium]
MKDGGSELGSASRDDLGREVRSARTSSMLSIFTSSGTLVCCALPALLVGLGAGAALSGLVSTVPQIVWLSANKELVFSVAALMLAVAGALQWRARLAPCPADPLLASACLRARRVSASIYAGSVVIFVVGVLFAFVLPALLG